MFIVIWSLVCLLLVILIGTFYKYFIRLNNLLFPKMVITLDYGIDTFSMLLIVLTAS